MRKAVWVVAAMFAAALAMSTGHADSGACSGGAVPPNAAGVGLKNTGPTGTPPGATGGSLAACNNGPVPVHGSVVIAGTENGTASNGYVDVDGDSTNSQPAGGQCSDGFFRVSGNGSGSASFYEDPNGNYDTDRSPAPGVQRKPAESPEIWAQNIAHNCTGQ